MAVSVKRTPGIGAQQLKNLLKNASNLEGRIGWFEGAKYPNGILVAVVAAIQEFGVPEKNIPARPFMRVAIKKYGQEWMQLIHEGMEKVLKGEATLAQVLTKVVLRGAAQVQRVISEIKTPILADATIAARLRKRADKKTLGNLNKPLDDTGYLLSTLIGKVTEK